VDKQSAFIDKRTMPPKREKNQKQNDTYLGFGKFWRDLRSNSISSPFCMISRSTQREFHSRVRKQIKKTKPDHKNSLMSDATLRKTETDDKNQINWIFPRIKLHLSIISFLCKASCVISDKTLALYNMRHQKLPIIIIITLSGIVAHFAG